MHPKHVRYQAAPRPDASEVSRAAFETGRRPESKKGKELYQKGRRRG